MAVGISALAYFATWRWVITDFASVGVSAGGDFAEWIRLSHPIRVIDPSWMGANDLELWNRWSPAEIKARLVVIFILSCCAMILNFTRSSRQTSAINTVQSTQEDARD